MHVIPVTGSIKVDGILDEAVWQHAVPATRFWQYAPLDRVPATENTEVRVVQDDRALYFGIICHDANPKGIIALDMRRDAPLSNDDYVGIHLARESPGRTRGDLEALLQRYGARRTQSHRRTPLPQNADAKAEAVMNSRRLIDCAMSLSGLFGVAYADSK